MLQELRGLRIRLTFYYTLILVLFAFLFLGFDYYNLFVSNGLMVDRDLKGAADQVKDLHILPLPDDVPQPKDPADNNKYHSEALLKFILRDENMNITKFSSDYPGLFQSSEKLAQLTWQEQEKRWDTINLDGNEYRIFSRPFHSDAANGVVQTYCNLTAIHKFLSTFIYFMGASGVAVIGIAAIIGWWPGGPGDDTGQSCLATTERVYCQCFP